MFTPMHLGIAAGLIVIFSILEYLLTRRAGWLGLVLPLVVTVMGILVERLMLFLLVPLVLFFLIGLRAYALRRKRSRLSKKARS